LTGEDAIGDAVVERLLHSLISEALSARPVATAASAAADYLLQGAPQGVLPYFIFSKFSVVGLFSSINQRCPAATK